MSMSWEKWEAMLASLGYSGQRIHELAAQGRPGAGSEHAALVAYAMGIANRLVDLSGPCTPPLSTAELRLRWQAGRTKAMAIREEIAAREGLQDPDGVEATDSEES